MTRKLFIVVAALMAIFAGCTPKEEFKETLSVNPTTIKFEGSQASSIVEITSNASWTATVSDSWLSVTPSKGTNNLSVVVKAKDYSGEGDRTGTVTITTSTLKKEITVTQSPDVVIPHVETFFSGGSGTESDPYLISSSTDIRDLLEKSNNKEHSAKMAAAYFSQTGDIDMAGATFSPMFQNESKFSGVYDGGGHKISSMKLRSTAKKASGFIAYANGGTVKNLILDNIDFDAEYVFAGAVIGYMENGAVMKGCTVSGQVRQYVSELNVLGENNEGYSGGLAGFVKNSTLEDCVLDGNVTIYGKYSGGIAGLIENSTAKNCKVLKDRTVNIYYHWNGGLFGKARGTDNLISGCSFEGNLTAVGYIQGAIVGQLEGGRVENCVMGSYGSIGSDKYFVGGIVGAIVPINEVTVNNCSAYGTIKGGNTVGGIVGYTGFLTSGPGKVSNATKAVTISNCAYIGGEITATGNNGGTNLYSIVSGVLGWSHGSNALTIKGCYSAPALIQTISVGNRGALAGIAAYQNSTSGNVVFENCYSTITSSAMLNCNDPVTSVSGYDFYGGIYCRSTQQTTIRNCFCDNSLKLGTGDSTASESGNETLATSALSDGTLLGKLQGTANGTTWVAGANGLPTIEGLPADPNVKPKAKKRVSVIGDSISTFKGWIPSGYSAHYPAADGTLTLVNETYWYRLIYDHMKSAELDMNIAFSGSTVTATTPENYASRYGTTASAWYGKDYTTRFIECGGCGRPDIILIHGGTNDWSHNVDPLAPGVAIRNDVANSYGGHAPSAEVMQSIFDKADAAKTREAVNALPAGTFCEAYVKLLCQIRERYPQCKVVCIIGDYLSQSIEESTLQIAAHYGAKTVNLFRVNGFNDLGGYSPETLSNKGSQPNMPKHDYSGDVSGCHPGSKAMDFIANKIYTELGAWLEQ